jgi:hypothetical protein
MGDRFGRQIAVAAGTAVIGARYHNHEGQDSGADYVFSIEGIFADGFESGNTSAWSSTKQ